MHRSQHFLQTDLALLRQLINDFVAKRQTRNILLKLTNDQKKDLGIAAGSPPRFYQISHSLW